MNINDTYKKLTNSKFNYLNVKVVASIPNLTDADYTRGYVTRYFTQKTNDGGSPIFEVSNTEFSKLASTVLYSTTSLRWRLIGSIEEIKKSNKVSVQLASTIITNLKMYLPNLIQFTKK